MTLITWMLAANIVLSLAILVLLDVRSDRLRQPHAIISQVHDLRPFHREDER